MQTVSPLQHLEPKLLWRHFQMLCDTPRPSKQEAAVIAKILAFASELQLDASQDEVGNVIIRKAASTGMENRMGVVLQSHLDMVPQKNNDKVHDFSRDPITPLADGDWIKADGTTLGADNGIGVATILAILESTDLAHGPLEALFTIDEEAGMTGAKGLSPGLLKGQLLFNLDTEDEGELYVGCAGGADITATYTHATEPTTASSRNLTFTVSGLQGGHSGLDIHLGRANANLIAAQFIARLRSLEPRLISFNGGSLRNALAREADVTFAIEQSHSAQLEPLLAQYQADLLRIYQSCEPQLQLRLVEAKTSAPALNAAASNQLCAALLTCPHGALRMSDSLEGIVETSNNLASVSLIDGNVLIKCMARSLVDTARDDLAANIAAHFSLIGARTVIDGQYPGWKPNMQSPLLVLMREVYREKYGHEPAVKVIHAGLECGLLAGAYPQWDMISLGPTIRRAHSPEEKVNVPSVIAFWQCVVAGLAAIPEQT